MSSYSTFEFVYDIDSCFFPDITSSDAFFRVDLCRGQNADKSEACATMGRGECFYRNISLSLNNLLLIYKKNCDCF